jgi:cysteine desulfurase family protein
VAELLAVSDPSRVIFCNNGTHALNQALKGLELPPGSHVITTSMEHNSVLRPLAGLAGRGIEVTHVPGDDEGFVAAAAIDAAVRAETRAIVLCHASNVSGTLQDAAEVGSLCRRRGLLFILDAAQTAGSVPLGVAELGVHLLAAPGHKGLLGPQGTGILYVAPELSLVPLIEGGTGTRSEERGMPEEFPEALEGGTLNTPGIAGLGAGVKYLLDRGLTDVHAAESRLLRTLLEGLGDIAGVQVYGPAAVERRVAVVSFNVRGKDGAHLGFALDEVYGIATRVGLHCAPDAHRTLGSFPVGTVRASLGPFSTETDVDALLRALGELARL